MKITHVSVRNYRSLKKIDLSIDSYTALVGANGSGKSSILYALDWFFRGHELDLSDVCDHKDGDSPDAGTVVEVTVTFGGLTLRDRERLGEYGRGNAAVFSRSWIPGEAKTKVVGNALQGPGFAELRAMKLVGDFRKKYVELRGDLPELPDLGKSPSKEEVVGQLAAWEGRSENASRLIAVDSADANHMFGINGPNVIRDCVRLVLVPASTSIAQDVGGLSKGSALSELIGTLMSTAGAVARADWLVRYADEVGELNRVVRESVETATALQADRINSRLSSFIPNARVEFKPTVPEWNPKNDATVSTNVVVDGIVNDVSRQGHGVQRAVMIAMFQSLVPDAAHAVGTLKPLDGESEDETAARLTNELAGLPALIICIEEPEIYQHPIRARTFARILTELSSQPEAQVLIATHSPYFVRPEQFASLRRLALVAGKSTVANTTALEVATAISGSVDQVAKIVEKRLPTSFSEGFFGDAVVLVEGDTDKSVIEALAEKLGLSLDSRGISVLDMAGKSGLRIPYAMFAALEIPAYVVADGDALGAARKYPNDPIKQAGAHASHQKATEGVTSWLTASPARNGTTPYVFKAPSVVADGYIVWEDDIEYELAGWGSFQTALTANGGALRRKDLLTYRTAVLDADLGDLPDTLRIAIQAIADFRQG